VTATCEPRANRSESIRELAALGWSTRRIAKAVGVSHMTVQRELARSCGTRVTPAALRLLREGAEAAEAGIGSTTLGELERYQAVEDLDTATAALRRLRRQLTRPETQ